MKIMAQDGSIPGKAQPPQWSEGLMRCVAFLTHRSKAHSPSQGMVRRFTYLFSTSWMVSGRGRFLVSGRRRRTGAAMMGHIPAISVWVYYYHQKLMLFSYQMLKLFPFLNSTSTFSYFHLWPHQSENWWLEKPFHLVRKFNSFISAVPYFITSWWRNKNNLLL